MNRLAATLVAVALVASGALAGCKKGRGERCYLDSDCADGLICEGKRCLPHIPCDVMERKVTECVDEILTVRHPGTRVSEQDRARYLDHFRNTHLRQCRRERGAYEDDRVGECFSKKDCAEFARCLLSLEKDRGAGRNAAR